LFIFLSFNLFKLTFFSIKVYRWTYDFFWRFLNCIWFVSCFRWLFINNFIVIYNFIVFFLIFLIKIFIFIKIIYFFRRCFLIFFPYINFIIIYYFFIFRFCIILLKIVEMFIIEIEFRVFILYFLCKIGLQIVIVVDVMIESLLNPLLVYIFKSFTDVISLLYQLFYLW